MNLAKHIADGHGCDPKKYRDILNIPRTTNLMCKEFVEKIADNSKEMFHNKLTQGQRDFLLKSVHNPTGAAGEIVSTIAAAEKNRGAKSKGKNRGMKHGRIQGKCHGCGIEIEISTQRVNRITKCQKCLKEKRIEGITKYQRENKERISAYHKQWYLAKKQIQKSTDN